MSTSPVENTAQAEYWESRAPSWISIEEYTGLVTGPFGRRAIDRLDVAPGQRVLDVGCGTGPTTIELARRATPGGGALGMDISATMIDAARARAAREGVDAAEFVVGDAQSAALGEGSFDAVFSRFGVMFFADPAAAFANLHRALRAGGRLAFSCWQPVDTNEWMIVPGMVIASLTGALPPIPGPGEPGPFSLADPDHVQQLLGGVGFGAVEVVPAIDQVDVGEDQIEFVVTASTSVGVVREALAANDDPAFAEQVRDAVRAAMVERVRDGRLRLESAAFVVTAVA
jgi:SAM-dependent methyltransferase